MNTTNNPKFTVVSPDEPILDLIKKISCKDSKLFGIAFVVNSENKLIGVINYADILRSINSSEGKLDSKASDVMTTNFVFVSYKMSDDEIEQSVRKQMHFRTNGEKSYTRYVPVLSEDSKLLDVVDMLEFVSHKIRKPRFVQVYGLGFVGLTLAVSLANSGHFVRGVDVNQDLIEQLKKCQPHIYEPRLKEMLQASLKNNTLELICDVDAKYYPVHIISVGTPVCSDGSPDLSFIKTICINISRRLRSGDLVMLRSTVPVGTSRNFVVPWLESNTDLKAGKDFHIAFAPERTVEGDALNELKNLPQIVGGYTDQCRNVASTFWQTFTKNVIITDSLEAAELVKLINNTYRDLSFSFANSLAFLSSKYNLDAFDIINIANEGYPRNPIPRPSPGVGGYCLTKDPYLFASVSPELPHANLARTSRYINEQSALYPFQVFNQYRNQYGLSQVSLNILIIGIAFKGQPNTNDVRESSSVTLSTQLSDQNCNVYAYDAVVDFKAIKNLSMHPIDNIDNIDKLNAVFIMNNHPNNIVDGLLEKLENSSTKTLLFDGWSLYEKLQVEKYSNIIYATMGYMTKI